MSGIKSIFLVVVTFLLSPPARGDEEVSCVFNESCILPCRFQAGDDVVIHWIHETAGNAPVHSYHDNQDQLFHQNQRFRGRTSLFKDQISRGNASLRLTGVEFQDQGRYMCKTITGNKETFINLKVDAPVRKVNIQRVKNKITCRSDGIYPEPELTWSTNPPSNMTLQNKTEVQQTEQLYNIISSLILSDSADDLTYICTISTQTSSSRASLKTLHSSTNVAGIAIPVVVGAILFVVLMVLGVYYVRNRTAARDPEKPEPSNGVSNSPEDILVNERENGGE